MEFRCYGAPCDVLFEPRTLHETGIGTKKMKRVVNVNENAMPVCFMLGCCISPSCTILNVRVGLSTNLL